MTAPAEDAARSARDEPMQYVGLVRHGRPDISIADRLDAEEFDAYLDRYDQASLDPALGPTADALTAARSASAMLCSDLPRAVESARLLAGDVELRVDSLFREVDLPRIDHGFLRMSPRAWTVLLRTLWFAGYSGGRESRVQARHRAAQCAVKLAELAEQHHAVLLVGHGLKNYLIGTALLVRGWTGPRIPCRSFWQVGWYRKRRDVDITGI